jgi:hypothetical protein
MKIKVFDIVSAGFFFVYPFPKTRDSEFKIKITWGGLQKWLQICAIFSVLRILKTGPIK